MIQPPNPLKQTSMVQVVTKKDTTPLQLHMIQPPNPLNQASMMQVVIKKDEGAKSMAAKNMAAGEGTMVGMKSVDNTDSWGRED